MPSSNNILDYLGRGPIATRPAKPKVSDTASLVFFETTDDGTIYTWDFAAGRWVPWASAGGTYVLPIANSTVLGGVKIDGITTAIGPDGTLRALGTGVSSFNTRKGDIALIGADVVAALAYTPYNGGTNPADFRSGVQVNSAIAVALTASLGQNLPQMDGTATIGVATLLAREDHIHPVDTSRYAASNPSNYQSDSQVAAAISGALANYIPLSQKGVSSGVASLDGTGRVPAGQLPTTATGILNYVSQWNPSTNAPTLASGALLNGVQQPKGTYVAASVTASFGAIDGVTTVNGGDWMVSNGTAWERQQTSAAPYLPLAGGTLGAPGTIAGIVGLTFTGGDVLGPPTTLLPDLSWGLLDRNGNVGAEFDAGGTMWLAALNAATATLTNATVTLLADPTTALGAATRQYVDALRGNTLPIVAGTATAGTALTLARSDHVHPFDPTRAPILSPVFQTSATLDIETWGLAIEPDIVWSMRDTANGNIVAWLDMQGTFSFASIAAAALSATSISGLISLAAQTAAFSTSATIAGETINDQTYPDLIDAVMGTNGNVVSGYDVLTGEFNVVSLNSQTGLKVAGQPLALTAPTAPTDAIDVRSAPYNAQSDGVRNHGYVTTAGSVLTITNFSGTITLAAVDATTARLDIVGTAWSGWAFQPHHEGKLLYLTVSGYTLLAAVKPHGCISGTAVLLDITGQTITPQTSVVGSLTLPAIDTTKPTTGKCLIVEGMGKYQYWTPTSVRSTDPVTPYGIHAWFTKTIASFTAPNQITITGSFPFNWTNQPGVVLWGTDDSAAAVACGLDVFPLKKRIWFSGTGLYLLPSLLQDNSEYPNYVNVVAGNPGPLVNGVIWAGDNSQVYALTTGGRRLPHRVSSQGAPRYDSMRKNVHGRLSFPRCAQIPASQAINVLIEGDSLGVFNSQGQVAQVMGATRFMAEFIRQNPGRRINFYNTAVGGSTWAAIASQNASYNPNSGNPYKFYTVPKPISGTVKRMDFWSNVNRTGSGAPIVPDLIVMFNNAGNDRTSFDVNSMLSVINYIRNIAHGDSYGPTDFVMQTDHIGFQVYGDGVSGGTALPGAAAASLNAYYNTGMNRTVAGNMGFPLVDYVPLIDRQAFGYDQTKRALRQVPQVTLGLSPTTPVGLSEDCLDFQFYISMSAAASEAAGWATMRQLEIQISQNPGNRLFLRLGPNGSIWAASSSVGLFTDTVVTCTTGAKTITLGAATSYPANVTFRGGWAAVDCADASITFDPATMNGLCVIANTGNYDGAAFGRPKQRNWIRAVMEPTVAMLHQINADFSDVTLTPALPIQIGPNQFIEQDNRAQPDVVIFYPDGTIFSTQVAYGGYVSPTQATLVDTPPQALTAQTVPMFLGRMGMKWFDTGIKPSATSTTGFVAVSVIGGAANFGWIDSQTNLVSQTYAYKTLERFGGAFTPVLYAQGAMQVTLVNRWVDEDIPIAASTPMWNQRGISSANSDYFTGGVGGHYGSFLQPAVLDALYSNQNLSVN